MHQRIKELRLSLDMSQEDIGKRLGVTRAAISRLENGERNLTEQMILSICREFSVNETWLRTGEGEMLVNNEISLMQWAGTVLGGSDESFKKRFVNMLSKLNEKDWETLEKIAILLEKNT